MVSQSYLMINPTALSERIHALVDELKAHDCQVPVTASKDILIFDVADCNFWWVASGGLKELFLRYPDVASWTDEFYPYSQHLPPAARLYA